MLNLQNIKIFKYHPCFKSLRVRIQMKTLIATALVAFCSICASKTYAFKDYGIDMGSCAPHSGWQSVKETASPGDFWFDVSIELSLTLDDWGYDENACAGADRDGYDWCVLTRQNMVYALRKCLNTANYMSRKHNRN